MFRLLFEMEELWLQSRQQGQAEQRVIEELCKIRAAACGRLKLADLQLAYRQAKSHFPELRVPSKLLLLWAKCYPLLAPGKVLTRADLDCFWHTVRQRWTQRRWFQIPPFRLAFSLFRDAQLCLVFFAHLARAS